MRIGVLSDLHCELDPKGSRWLNQFESDQLDRRVDEALAWFADERVDLLLLLGDIVQFANVGDLEHVLAHITSIAAMPVAVVNGNHDVRLGDAFADSARTHGITLLTEASRVIDRVSLVGVEVERGQRLPQYLGSLGAIGDGVVTVVASHFPLLSQASRIAAVGVPYAGDIANRAELEDGLARRGGPVVVLSGHTHVRCSSIAGAMLQLTVGALIEPPFDATILEVDPVSISVSRHSRRLGPVAPLDPVFAPDQERWTWTSEGWAAA